jgi:hypothetical protein
VFFVTAGVYAFGTIVYGLFGSGEKQDWAASVKPPEEEMQLNDASRQEKETKST